jgi:hypothetical protein
MIEAKTKSMRSSFSLNKYLLFAIIMVILLAFGFYDYNTSQRFNTPQAVVTTITQSNLEKNYGLRVQLLAVTAAGGFVDLRLQIVDASKAQALLKDNANLPALKISDDVVLRTSEDAAEQDIQFENGKSIFVMYANSGNILKPGDPVNIIFGNLQLETINSK